MNQESNELKKLGEKLLAKSKELAEKEKVINDLVFTCELILYDMADMDEVTTTITISRKNELRKIMEKAEKVGYWKTIDRARDKWSRDNL